MTIYVLSKKHLKPGPFDNGERRVMMSEAQASRIRVGTSQADLARYLALSGMKPTAECVAPAPADSKLLAAIAKDFDKHKEDGTCAAIRAVSLKHKVHVSVIVSALPNVNASTVRTQFAKARKEGK